ncbi:MAG: RpiB/LacA/LacB family sugar-phosphate isomerase [Geminicoccaceae bacterium]
MTAAIVAAAADHAGVEDADILVLGARAAGQAAAGDNVGMLLDTAFAGGRDQRRVEKLA